MEIEKVYKLYFKDVYTFLYGLSQNKAVAEDITQDTFLKAMKNIDLFDGRKDIKAWLFTIARNTYYTEYNRQKFSRLMTLKIMWMVKLMFWII